MLSPREISDHIEIAQVVQRYGLALDEKEYELLDSVFTPGADLRYQLGDRTNTGTYPDWVKRFRDFLAPFYWTQHLFSQPVIDLEGDTARSTCRLVARHLQLTLDGDRNVWTVYGHYRDVLTRGEAGWRIRERRFQGLHTEGQVLAPDRVQQFPTRPWQ